MTTGSRRLGPLWLPLALALGLMGCPDLPRSPPEDLDASVAIDGMVDVADGELITPLSLDRVVESRSSTSGDLRVTIHGAGFTEGASVEFGGVQATGVLTLDEEQINCDVPGHAAGLVDVTVTLPDGQRAVLQDAFLYESDLALTSIAPTVALCRGGVEVTIRGQGFSETTVALIGGRQLKDAQVVDGETIVGVVPERLISRAGLVSVIASDGIEQRVLEREFRYVNDLDVVSLTPVTGPVEGGSFVTLRGTGLHEDTVVSVSGQIAEVVSPGDGEEMMIRTPPASTGSPRDPWISPCQALFSPGTFRAHGPMWMAPRVARWTWLTPGRRAAAQPEARWSPSESRTSSRRSPHWWTSPSMKRRPPSFRSTP